MSLSRFAAIGASLVAGVTLASCAGSNAPIPGTGPNQSVINFPGGASRVRFVQGSPNLNLAITTVDLYIDNQFAGTYPYGAVGPWIYSLPVGVHRFQLVQTGTHSPVFLDTNFTIAANNKYAVVAEGDAAVHSTKMVLFTEAHYNTPSGTFSTSFFNASPRNPTAGMQYNCQTGGPPCLNGIGVNSILFHSVNDAWCFAAYNPGNVLIATAALPAGTNPVAGTCAAVFLVPTTTAPNNNMDLFLVDDSASPSSRLLIAASESNG